MAQGDYPIWSLFMNITILGKFSLQVVRILIFQTKKYKSYFDYLVSENMRSLNMCSI